MLVLSVVSMAVATDKAAKDGKGGNGSRSGWIGGYRSVGDSWWEVMLLSDLSNFNAITLSGLLCFQTPCIFSF